MDKKCHTLICLLLDLQNKHIQIDWSPAFLTSDDFEGTNEIVRTK